MVEQWNSDGGKVKVEQWRRKREQCWLNRETEMVEPWNSDSGKVEQCGWNSVGGTVWWTSFSGTVDQ